MPFALLSLCLSAVFSCGKYQAHSEMTADSDRERHRKGGLRDGDKGVNTHDKLTRGNMRGGRG